MIPITIIIVIVNIDCILFIRLLFRNNILYHNIFAFSCNIQYYLQCLSDGLTILPFRAFRAQYLWRFIVWRATVERHIGRGTRHVTVNALQPDTILLLIMYADDVYACIVLYEKLAASCSHLVHGTYIMHALFHHVIMSFMRTLAGLVKQEARRTHVLFRRISCFPYFPILILMAMVDRTFSLLCIRKMTGNTLCQSYIPYIHIHNHDICIMLAAH